MGDKVSPANSNEEPMIEPQEDDAQKDDVFPSQGPEAIDSSALETFEYEYPEREVELEISTDEFTAVCPFSGLPDFATIRIAYVPDKKCIELRSLKYYLCTFRNVGIFHEHIVNRILEDLVRCCRPKRMRVTGDYKVRGGIHTVASVEYRNSE